VEFLNFLQEVVGGAGGVIPYAVVFGVLLGCGLGIPMPEDISLIFGGFLVFEEQAVLWLMMLTGYVGIILGDSMIFYFGRRLGSKVGSREGGFFSRIVTPQKRARVEGLFKRHGEKIVMIARFLPGVRAVTYFTAGSVGMRYSHFIFFDSIAALGSAPIFVYLGYRFGGQLEFLIHQIAKGQRSVVVGMVVVLVVIIGISRWRSKREARLNAEALRQKEIDDRTTTKA
jgi:membrane protein DedA with SNARE-associated domain